jgi:GT2 family glycosyltransferase
MAEIPEKASLPPDLYARNTVVAFLAGKLCKKEKPAVLDVGGYNGRLAEFFGECSKFIVLDRKGKPKDETCEYRQADAKKIPFSDRNFDIVVAMDFLEHVPVGERAQVVKEMLRVSKDFVFIGAPLKSGLVQTAEDQVRSQFFANAGREHPFLIEHEEMGLPAEEEVDALLTEAGARFFKVREGNLMNWYLQQLYAGTHWGANGSLDKYGFYTFYNEHLSQLGDLRPPTYRTIYCLAKETQVNESEIYAALQSHFTWSTETFMQLMRIAFDDLRFIIDGKKEQIESMEGTLAQKETALAQAEQSVRESGGKLTETVEKARRSVEAYRQAVTELRNFLQEKEQALNLVRGMLKETEQKLNEAKKGISERDDFIRHLNVKLEDKVRENEKMRGHIYRTEKAMQDKNAELAAREHESGELRRELNAHGKALSEILNSRAWKAVMIYSRIKMGLVVKPARAVKHGAAILAKLGPKVFMQRLARKIRRPKNGGASGGYDRYVESTAVTATMRGEMRRKVAGFGYAPLISIVMPVYNVNEKWLNEAIESVRRQSYAKWELCICDDASTSLQVRLTLEKYAAEDKRIKVCYRQKNGGIVKASNDALALATGAYVGLLDNDDALAPDALYRVVEALQEKKYDLVYTDEDKLGADGKRCEPFFKPDWSPDLLLSCNYISHFGVYRRKILGDIGGFREGYDGSQDYDLVLRFTEKTQEIKHIPRVLYHWRKVKGSTAESVEAKPFAYEAAKKALADAARRRRIDATVEDGLWTGSYRLRRAISFAETAPLVSIIIPFKDKVELLDKCLRSIYENTTWKNFEVLIVDNDSELLETSDYLERAPSNYANLTVLKYAGAFNYPAINNFAASKAKGEYLVLLNNDTETVSPDWIEAMLEQAQRKEVGAVGAKLLYPDGTIQHAGVVIGLGGLAGHAFSRQTDIDHGYFGLIDVVRNYSAVTAACLMVRKSVFLEAGGMDENNLSVSFNDVDFCLKIREKGYLIVYTPYAVLKHHECATRGYGVDLAEVAHMQRRHAGILEKGDPYYNPNLTRERGDFSLRVMDKVG